MEAEGERLIPPRAEGRGLRERQRQRSHLVCGYRARFVHPGCARSAPGYTKRTRVHTSCIGFSLFFFGHTETRTHARTFFFCKKKRERRFGREREDKKEKVHTTAFSRGRFTRVSRCRAGACRPRCRELRRARPPSPAESLAASTASESRCELVSCASAVCPRGKGCRLYVGLCTTRVVMTARSISLGSISQSASVETARDRTR